MTRVTAYVSSDNELFRTKADYIRHESNLLAEKSILAELKAKASSDGTPEGDAARDKLVNEQFAVLTKTLGLNKLREILDTKFKPSKDDDKDDTSAGNDGAADGASGAPADGNGANVPDGAPQPTGSDAPASASPSESGAAPAADI